MTIVIIPLVSFCSLPLYHYISLPERHLLKSYKQIRKLNAISDFDENDWEFLREQLEAIPPNVQTLVYYDYSVLISDIPELKMGTKLSPMELFEFIRNTSRDYDYQFQSPRNFQRTPRGEHPFKFIIVSRSRVPDAHIRPTGFYIIIFSLIFIFETSCLVLIIRLSRTISSSITILEESTEKIAQGELNTKIEAPQKGRNSNEITYLAQNLEKMRISLKDSQDKNTKFIMGISHDLRTPVALIKGYTEAITDGVAGDFDSVKKSLSIIHTKAEQLENMINDLINYVKLNNTDWRQKLEKVPIEPFLSEFAQSAIYTAEVYNRNITKDIQVSSQTMIPMDKNLFQRALENLLSNALRYTKDGDSIFITAIESEQDIKISVQDTGFGISDEDLEHIYDLFYRGSNSRREQGMGIGLSVVKTIVDTHGWTISVKSKLQQGTSFVISIPK